MIDESVKRHWKGHSGIIADSVDGFDIIECEACEFKHIVPIPTEQELTLFYEEKFYTGQNKDYWERQQQDIEWWNMVFQERYQLFEKFLEKDEKRILDIGCGPGFFLKYGKENGWETLGIEPSHQASDFARSLGLEIIAAPLNEKTISSLGKFDVIYMNGVMEHLPNPLEFLNLGYQLLEPSGLFFTCVANEYNPFQRIMREFSGLQPWWLVPPEHINYFSIDSAVQLVSRGGFEVIHSSTTFPIDFFLLCGDNYISNESTGIESHQRRKNFEFSLVKSGNQELKREIYDGFAKLNLGREIEVIGRKSPD